MKGAGQSGRPARMSLSTRLVLVNYTDTSGTPHKLRLISERATDTMRMNPMDFGPSGILNERTAYLGPVATDDRGLIQWVDPSKILPPTISDRLFRDMPSA